jgi:hypothetical protein
VGRKAARIGRSRSRGAHSSFLRRRRVGLTLAVSAAIGAFAAFLGVYQVTLAPPGFHARSVMIGTASTYLMLDTQRGLVPDHRATDLQFNTYTEEATLFADLLASDPVRDMVAQHMGLNPDQISTFTRLTGLGDGAFTATRMEQRAAEILAAPRLYKLEMQPDPALPVISIYAQAPTAAGAEDLANTAVVELKRFVAENPADTGFGTKQHFVLRQLGTARGGIVSHQTEFQIVLLTFLVVFGLACALLFGGMRVRRGFIAAGRRRPADGGAELQLAEPIAAEDHERVSAWRSLASVGGDWPRTTRVMPWLIAIFLFVIWLVPFNDIQLSASLPFDLKFDRLVLPILFLVWILSIAVGGPAVPRVKLTRIHVGFLAFVSVVGIGIVLNAQSLNQLMEFNLSTKKLTLLMSYGVMMAIIASSVRRSELRAYFKYSLVLAVICAIGSIVEYRFHYNVFYDLSGKLLGKVFSVASYDPNAVDELGRRMTRGPSDHPLELVGMLSMMLPLALVGIVQSVKRRERFWYSVAACLLLAAALTTDRKSSLLAPLAVVLTIAFYYRRKLLRLAPLALVSLIVIHVLSPGALGTVVKQLNPSNLGVSTVTDRAADYDAVRSDLWTHVLFGRGYGSYDHINYRVLDSDMLSRLVDTGVLGIVAFLFLLGCIISSARRVLRHGDRARAPNALAVAAAAVAYFVLMFLFDVSSFPHVPYILLSLAGLLAVEETRGGTAPTIELQTEPADPHRRQPIRPSRKTAEAALPSGR